VLDALGRAGLPVPRTWILESSHFDAFVASCLPPKHDLRSLVKASGSRTGDYRCARAYERLRAEPLPAAVIAAVEQLWQREGAELPRGLAVRPSLAAEVPVPAGASRYLCSIVGQVGPEQTLEGIRRLWASAVLSCVVGAYAEAALKRPSLAVLLQQVVPTEPSGLLPLTEPSEPTRAKADPATRLAQAIDERGLRPALDPMAATARRLLGPHAQLRVAIEPGTDQAEDGIHVLSAHAEPSWPPLGGGSRHTLWREIGLAGPLSAPPTALGSSLLETVLPPLLRQTAQKRIPRAEARSELVATWAGRSYLNATALCRAAARLPLFGPEALVQAMGGGSADQLEPLLRQCADLREAAWRRPLSGAQSLTEMARIEREAERALGQLVDRSARAAPTDLGLLPDDALETTFATARAILERSLELWLRCARAHLAEHVALQSLVRRRFSEALPNVAYGLTGGAGEPYGAALGMALAEVAAMFRADERAVDQLRQGQLHAPSDLPPSPARAALDRFLASFGDAAVAPFELSRPRWREDLGELGPMLLALIEAPEASSTREPPLRARALADAELARYEPYLSRLERPLVRALVRRAWRLGRLRGRVDRQLLRALWLLRQVVLDVDRRLLRNDPDLPQGAAFHCRAEPTLAALATANPELGRLVRMRLGEHRQMLALKCPPPVFVGGPPRARLRAQTSPSLTGLGVSPGAAEGRARLVRDGLPDHIGEDDILVVTAPDPCLSPLMLVARALVSDTGGCLSPGAEVARAYALPAVANTADATELLREGERLRVDGTRGIVQRLER